MDHPDEWSKYNLDFHMEEFRYLKSEVLQLGAEAETLLRFVLVGDAAVVAWLLSSAPHDPALSVLAGWIPFLLTALSAALAFTYSKRILLTRGYLLDLETVLTSKGRGWEHYIERKTFRGGGARTPNSPRPRANLWSGRIITVIWILALVSSVIFATYWNLRSS